MASHQATKKDTGKSEDNKEGHSEEPKVMQLAHKFESLADQVKESDITIGEQGHGVKGKVSSSHAEEKRAQEDEQGHSLEEIRRFRQQAQQNSMEAIREAEERYSKAQDLDRENQQRKESREKTGIAKDTTNETESNLPGLTTAAKDTILSAGKTAMDYTQHTAVKAKDFASQNVVPTVVQVGKSATSYAGQAAVVAKDTGVGVGKSAVGYAGQATVVAKDTAVETSWRVAHYSLEKAAELAEATANVEHRAAELAAQKAEQARQEAIMKEQETQKNKQEMKQNWEQAKNVSKQGEQWEDVSTNYGQNSSSGPQAAQNRNESDGGLLGAVGETLFEIAKSTKDLVIGQDPKQKN